MLIGVDATCWWNQRGFGRMARELLKAMFELPSEHRFCLFVDQAPDEAMQRENIEIVQVFPKRPLTAAARVDDRRSLLDLWRMHSAVKKSGVDLFFFPAVYSWFPIPSALPTMVTLHDAIAERFPELIFPNRRGRLLWNLKMKLALRSSDRVLTVSQAAKAEIVEYIGVPAAGIDVISEAPGAMFSRCEVDQAELRRRLDLPAEGRLVIYVGGLAPHKNLHAFMRAFAEARKQPGAADLHLVLVGDYAGAGFHSNYEELRQLAESSPLEGAVHFTGFVSDGDLVLLYNSALAAAMPSLSEGFGLPAVEAMACGTPVLSSDQGSLPEVVGEAGLYFDPYDCSSIREAIVRMASDQHLRDSLGAKAELRAASFTWKRAAGLTLGFLEQLAEGS